VDDDSDELSDDAETDSDDISLSRAKASRGRQTHPQRNYQAKDFSNKLASVDAAEKEILDAKVGEWRENHSGNMPNRVYEQFWAEACEEVRIKNGGTSRGGRRASRKPSGFTYSADAHSLEVDDEQVRMQRALVMSMQDKK
jgi:hypothetical protein